MPTVSAESIAAGDALQGGNAAQVPAGQAAERVLLARCDALGAVLKRARRSSRIAAATIHKMRVASRRLAVLLDVLADWFPRRERKAVAHRARRLRRKCGRVRDLDVQLASLATLRKHVGQSEGKALALALAVLRRQRHRKGRKLQVWLKPFAARFKRDCRKLLRAVKKHRHHATARPASFGAVGMKMLSKVAEKLWSRQHDLARPKGMHRFRIAVKRLRYVNEIFLPVLDSSFRGDFQPQLVHIQDVLGEFQNAATALKLLSKFDRKLSSLWRSAKGKKAGPRNLSKTDLAPGLAAARRAYSIQKEKALREFLELWPGFAGDSFRHPFEALVRRPAAGATEERRSNAIAETINFLAAGELPRPGHLFEPLP